MSYWALPSLTAAVVLSALTLYVILHRPPTPLWPSTVAIMLSVLLFSAGKAASYFVADSTSYWLTTAVSYSGLMFVGSSSWLIAHRFSQACGRPFALSATWWVYVPTLIVLPVWCGMITNPIHGQFMTLNLDGPHDHHWLWFAQAGVSYFCTLMAFILYARLIFRVDSRAQRLRICIMLVAPFVTVSANLFHMSPATNLPFDPTPIALATTSVLFFFGIYRVGIFSLSSVAMSEVIAHQPHGIVVTDNDGVLLYWNNAADAALRTPLAAVDTSFDLWLTNQLSRDGAEECLDPEVFKRRTENLPIESPLPLFQLLSDPQHWLQIRVDNILSRTKRVVGRSFFIRDMSRAVREEDERLQLERRMFQLQKLEGLGVLAGGIAHDFNNLLMVIRGNAELLGVNETLDDDALKKVASIEVVSERAARLTKKLLESSGEATLVRSPLDLSELIRESSELFNMALAPKRVRVVLELAEDCPVAGDQSQLTQILMNLTLNASESYDEAGGTVVIATRRCHPAAVRRGYCLHASAEDYAEGVLLEVSDVGCGMSAERVERIADPFFSSKGYGRGLGLSAVVGIVRGHDGSIYVDSSPGSGSTFLLLFPTSS